MENFIDNYVWWNNYIGVFTKMGIEHNNLDSNEQYKNLYFFPVWFNGYNDNYSSAINSYLLSQQDHLDRLSFDLLNYHDILDKLSSFNQINSSLFEEINFIFVSDPFTDTRTENHLIVEDINVINSLVRVNFCNISFTTLFQDDKFKKFLWANDEKKIFYFIFNNQFNQNEKNIAYNLIKNNKPRIFTSNENQFLSLIGKFYSNNILIHNSFIMDNQFHLNDNLSLNLFKCLFNNLY